MVVALKSRLHNENGTVRGGSMGRALSVILVENGEAEAETLSQALSEYAIEIHRCNRDGFEQMVQAQPVDAVLSFTALDVSGYDFPCISLGMREPSAAAFLDRSAHPIQVAARLRGLVRLNLLETVARARRRDAEAAGVQLASAQTAADNASVLFVGSPCPAFMRLQHALAGSQTEVVAAFSTFSAFDYLHERAFDAVVLNTQPDPDLAHTVCSAMRRNTRLYHTPAILLTQPDQPVDAEEAFARGASDVLSEDASEDQIRERIGVLGMERRRRRRAKAGLESSRTPLLLDRASDLYVPDFGVRHMETLLSHWRQTGRDLSFIGIRADAPREASLERVHYALDQFASMLRHCVRAEDFAVRQTPEQFYIALPNTHLSDAKSVADRICAIAECTAYDGLATGQPFRLDLAAHVCGPLPELSSEQMITHIMTATAQQGRFAAYA